MLEPDFKKLKRIENGINVDQKYMAHQGRLLSHWYNLRRQFVDFNFIAPSKWRLHLRHALNRKRVRPDFVILGAVRSGTTQLSEYIFQHPSVSLPIAKEISFQGVDSESMFLSQFPSSSEVQKLKKRYGTAVTGYCTPSIPHLASPYLIKSLNPNIKIIVILRNPVERVFAHWRWDQMISNKLVNDPLFKHMPDIEELLTLEMETIKDQGCAHSFQSSGNAGGYIEQSNYLPYVKLLLNLFDREQITFINAQNFFQQPRDTAKSLYQFLSLPEYEPIRTPVKNASVKNKKLRQIEPKLRAFFAPINQELFEVIGKEYDW